MYDTNGYEVEEELDEELQGPNNNGLTWHQRLFGALSDIADISAEEGGFLQSDLIRVVNFWSIDPPVVVEDGASWVELGVDQLKLIEAISHHTPSEEEIDAAVAKTFEKIKQQAEYMEMDQVDLMVAEMEQDLEVTSNVVAYLMAVLNNERVLSHEIIDEMGCVLVHVLTQWFFMYMIEREVLPPSDNDIEAIKAKVSELAMSTAQLAALPKDQKRAKLENAIEGFRHFGEGHISPYDQDEDGEGDAPL